MQHTIRDIIREEAKKRNLSLYQLAREIGVEPTYLYLVLSLKKVSRSVVYKLSEYLHRYDLLYWYEKELMARNAESKISSGDWSKNHKEVFRVKKGYPPESKNSQEVQNEHTAT